MSKPIKSSNAHAISSAYAQALENRILTLPSGGRPSNLQQWKEANLLLGIKEIGVTASILENNVPYQPTRPTKRLTTAQISRRDLIEQNRIDIQTATLAAITVPTTAIPALLVPAIFTAEQDEEISEELLLHQQRLGVWSKAEEEVRQESIKLYAWLFGNISEDSVSRLRENEVFRLAEPQKNLSVLLARIDATHTGAATGSEILDNYEARKCYYHIRQTNSENIFEYKSRFERAVKGMITQGELPLTDQQYAVDFIRSLDTSRFGVYQTKCSNECRSSRTPTDGYPTTLPKAFDEVAKFRVLVIPSPKPTNQVLLTYKESDATATASSKPKTAGTKHQESSGSQESISKKPDFRRNRRTQEKSNVLRVRPCRHCGGEHWDSECSNSSNKNSNVTSSVTSNKNHSYLNLLLNNSDNIPIPEGGEFENEVVLHSAVDGGRVSQSDILLDSQSTIHLFNNHQLLNNIRKAQPPLTVRGIGGDLLVTKCGDSPHFGTVMYSPTSPANILSLGQLAKQSYSVKYEHANDSFIISSDKIHPIVFSNVDNLYCYRVPSHVSDEATTFISTVVSNEKLYTKRQVSDAKKAQHLQARLGYPSAGDLINLINSGSIMNCPITGQDVTRAISIYGPDLGSLKGKTTFKVPTPAVIDPIEVPSACVDLMLHVDIMFVESIPFLVSVSTPLQLTTVLQLEGGKRTKQSVEPALIKMINAYSGKRFRVHSILTDGEKSVAAASPTFESMGISINTSGAGQHVPVVERKIRQIKERVRAIFNTLPYDLPFVLVPHLVLYCVQTINAIPSSTALHGVSPREIYLGRKLDFKRDTRVCFGEYAQTHSPHGEMTHNSLKPRTVGAIALRHQGNVQGSVLFLCLTTFRTIVRDQFTILPMPSIVIEYINILAGRQKKVRDPIFTMYSRLDEDIDNQVLPSPVVARDRSAFDAYDLSNRASGMEVLDDEIGDVVDPLLPIPTQMLADNITDQDIFPDVPILNTIEVTTEPVENYHIEGPVGGEASSIEELEAIDPLPDPEVPPELFIDPPELFINNLEENDQTEVQVPDVAADVPVPPSRYNLRPNRASQGRWASNSKKAPLPSRPEVGLHITATKAINQYGKKAIDVITEELRQMIDRNVWTPVQRNLLPPKHQVIRSSLFLKEKFDAEGTFDKLKARLVAGGNQQDKSLYDDLSSPTIATDCLLLVGAIAAEEKRIVTTCDIAGAYLNAFMPKSNQVYMIIEPRFAKIIGELRPNWKPFLNWKGELCVVLDKALYGCVESAVLWYQNLTSTLESLGFVSNPYDVCVLNMKSNLGVQCTVGIHVDDLIITCTDQAMHDKVHAGLRKAYGEIKVTTGKVHNYLGMTLDFTEDEVMKVSMEGYVKDILETYKVVGTSSIPASTDLFEVKESPLLPEALRKELHSRVPKLMFLAKRVRPDLLPALAFLSTRITIATDDDWKKMNKLLKYLNGTRELIMRIGVKDHQIHLIGSIDSSYGVHANGRSHTGCAITVGRGTIFGKSSAQKIVTKSSTEAELVGVTDSMSPLIKILYFLRKQGLVFGPAVIHQDNMSTMALIERGRPTTERSRHIHIRHFFVKDRVEAGEVQVEHQPTELITADALTKPLAYVQLVSCRDVLLGYKTTPEKPRKSDDDDDKQKFVNSRSGVC